MDMGTPHSRSDLSAAFAEQLRAERAAARLSRADLASAAGISAKAVQRLEENEREMDTDQLARICRALGVPVLEFVTRATGRMPPTTINASDPQADTRTAG